MDEIQTQDRVSEFYKKRHTGVGFLWHARVTCDMLAGCKFRDGRTSDKILDVGCGTGFLSQLFPNFDITGVDISDGMLAKNPYKWVKGSVYELPFDSNSFDWVVSRGMLHHLEDPRKGMREMSRVLRPGGRFVCYETNWSFLNSIPRYLATFTGRFSRQHKNFKIKKLEGIVSKHLQIYDKRFYGYLSVPLLGFPDILDLKIPIGLGEFIMRLDSLISKSPLRGLAFNSMIKAVKTV